MLTFREWIEYEIITEAADRWGDRDYVPIYQRDVYRRGVSQGLEAERGMRNQMQQLGFEVYPSTSHEDRNLGIDGYVKINGKLHSMQLKRRTTTNDLTFELSMDRTANDRYNMPHPLVFLNNINGKDAKWNAEYYFVRDVTGQEMYMVETRFAKVLIMQAVKQWIQLLSRSQNSRYTNNFLHGSNGVRPTMEDHYLKLKIIWDNEKHVWKLMAYIKPEVLGKTIPIPKRSQPQKTAVV